MSYSHYICLEANVNECSYNQDGGQSQIQLFANLNNQLIFEIYLRVRIER